MVEEWKDIIGFEGIYQVSNLGNIKSIERTKIICDGRIAPVREKILSHTKIKNRYKSVTLCKNANRTNVAVHILVANAFLQKNNSTDVVNHIDGNTLNNSVSNLEYCSQSHNVKHSYILNNASQKGSLNANAILNEFHVHNIKSALRENTYTCKELSLIYNVSYYAIRDIKRNRTWKNVQ